MNIRNRWLFTLLCVLLGIGFLSLGFWQWHRYHLALEQERWAAQAAGRPPVHWSLHLQPYQRVQLEGVFDDAHTVLWVNRLGPRGQPEAEVYTPFRLREGGVILVSRGFVAMPLPKGGRPRGQH